MGCGASKDDTDPLAVKQAPPGGHIAFRDSRAVAISRDQQRMLQEENKKPAGYVPRKSHPLLDD